MALASARLARAWARLRLARQAPRATGRCTGLEAVCETAAFDEAAEALLEEANDALGAAFSGHAPGLLPLLAETPWPVVGLLSRITSELLPLAALLWWAHGGEGGAPV